MHAEPHAHPVVTPRTDRVKFLRLAVGIAVLVAICAHGYAAMVHHALGDRALDPLALPVYHLLFIQYDVPASAVALALVLVSATALAVHERIDCRAALTWIAAHPIALAAVCAVVYAAGAVWIFGGYPIVVDEYAPLMQSRIFANGRLFGQLPPEMLDRLVPLDWQGHFIKASHATGAVASAYWPAFALALTPFTALGVPWLFNPIATACTLVMLERVLRSTVRSIPARGFALLATAVSPAIALNATSLYAMPLLLLTSTAFTWLILRGTTSCLVLAGVVGSVALTAINPVPHTLYAIAWLIYAVRSASNRPRALLALAAGYAPLSMLLGVGWPLVTGLHTERLEDISTASVGSMLAIFSLPDMDLLATRTLALLKIELWSVPGLVALALLGARLAWRGVGGCFVASALLTMVGYLFIPFDQGPGWGYRYFHAAWLALPVLAAQAWAALESTPDAPRMRGFLTAAVVGTLLVLLPLRATQLHAYASAQRSSIPARQADALSLEVVFVDMGCGPRTAIHVQNDPFLQGNELRVIDAGARANAQFAARLSAQPVRVGVARCGERWRLP